MVYTGSKQNSKRPLESYDPTFVESLVQILEDSLALKVEVIDLSAHDYFCEYMIIGGARSARHLSSLADYLIKGVRTQGVKLNKDQVEGTADSGWMIVDFWNVVVHLQVEELREYYDLDKYWKLAQSVTSTHTDT